MRTEVLLLAAAMLPDASSGARVPGLELEAGIVVDVFSESYGAGDLFFDRGDLPGQDDVADEEEPLRIRNDETLVGGRLALSWSPGASFERGVELEYEQNEASAVADGALRWRFGDAVGWRLDADERLRFQAGLGGDESRDVFHTLALDLSRPLGDRSRLALLGEQTFSRVSGDSLSRLFDHTFHSLGVRLDRELGALDARWTIDAAYRDAADDVTSNYVRARAVAEIHRYAFDATTFDVVVEVNRKSYDDTGLISPSSVEVFLDGRIAEPVGGGFQLIAEGDLLEVRFDDPDPTYFDYATGTAEAGAAWRSVGGVTLDATGGGEWLRPRDDVPGAYDQWRVRLGGSTLGPGGLWADVEESFGRRNHLGTAPAGGILTDQGSLGFSYTDFFYNELSLLLGYEAGVLGVDAYAQYTVEKHEDEADDVSYVLVNLRVVSRF